MNIGIIGYGKMGKMIHEVASSRGHNIGVILKEPNWQSQEVAGLDVVIEFTNPKSAVENIKKCFLEKVILCSSCSIIVLFYSIYL